MGCFEGTEICELFGTYIQNKLTNIMNKEDIGLYGYDGLSIFRNISRSEIEKKKKAIVKVFKKCGLSIVVDTNLKTVDFLDETFNLGKNIHKPYRKPNNSPIDITKNLNHRRSILKQLQKSIAKRISEALSSEEIFNKSKFTAKHSRRVASWMNPNVYQMKYKNLQMRI